MSYNRFAHIRFYMKWVLLPLLFLSLCGIPTFSSALGKLGRESLPVSTVELSGVSGESNNVVFVFGRYALVAPHAPSVEVTENTRLDELDNDQVFLIDTQNPQAEPLPASLSSSREYCFYPTKIQYDERTYILYVRGTHFEETPDGDYEPREVISYLDLNLSEDGKPVFNLENQRAVTFPIPGRGTEFASDAPSDFVLGRGGEYVVFSNGAYIYTYSRISGNFSEVQKVQFVQDENYDAHNRISYLGIEEETNTLIVAVNKKENGRYLSEIHFYRLEENGTVTEFKYISPNDLPEEASFIAGSSVAVSLDRSGETPTPDSAYFVLSNGGLYQVDLDINNETELTRLEIFPALVSPDPANASPRNVQYDAAKRLISIVKRGHNAQIVRPVYNRPGKRGKRGIVRPVYIGSEPPAIVFAQLKKNRVVRFKSIEDERFTEGLRLTDLIFDQSARGFVASYTGDLFAIDLSSSIDRAKIKLLGQVGDRVDAIAYNPDRVGLVALNSFHSGEGADRMVEPGAVVLADIGSLGSSPRNSSLAAISRPGESALPTASSQGEIRAKLRRGARITRPCHVTRSHQ